MYNTDNFKHEKIGNWYLPNIQTNFEARISACCAAIECIKLNEERIVYGKLITDYDDFSRIMGKVDLKL